jgi:hypothetical protein
MIAPSSVNLCEVVKQYAQARIKNSRIKNFNVFGLFFYGRACSGV